MISELEGYRWDAIFLSETWRSEKSEIWETHHKHILTGAGKFDNKHGVGIMLTKKWRQQIIDTEYISERAITTTIVVNQQRIKLMSVYFTHSGYADQHIQKIYKTIEKRMTDCEKYIPIVGGDFNAELDLGYKTKYTTVGRHSQRRKQKNDWMKHCLMLQRIYSTQHNVQKDTCDTNDLQISKR